MNRRFCISSLASVLALAALGAQAAPWPAQASSGPILAMMDDMSDSAMSGPGNGGAGSNGMTSGGSMGTSGMGGMGGMGGMDNMGMGMGMGGNMTPSPGGAMPPQQMRSPMSQPGNMDMMGMMRRGSRAGMSSMPPMSSLPGFPGASHLYHVGATGFFLDHPQHIKLSTEQQSVLNRLRERWQLDRGAFERRIEDAEQELWVLTAADAPEASKIDDKIRSIEKLRADQRLAFIRTVGEAARVLTPEQRAMLLGNTPAAGMSKSAH